jgi:predicted RNA-binding Zn-ribbon protein involved in translation (DUF1610 family)
MPGNRTTRICDECESAFFSDASRMNGLCPQCAHVLYGYPVCEHIFDNGRCVKCGWDGSASAYIRFLLGKPASSSQY